MLESFASHSAPISLFMAQGLKQPKPLLAQSAPRAGSGRSQSRLIRSTASVEASAIKEVRCSAPTASMTASLCSALLLDRSAEQVVIVDGEIGMISCYATAGRLAPRTLRQGLAMSRKGVDLWGGIATDLISTSCDQENHAQQEILDKSIERPGIH